MSQTIERSRVLNDFAMTLKCSDGIINKWTYKCKGEKRASLSRGSHGRHSVREGTFQRKQGRTSEKPAAFSWKVSSPCSAEKSHCAVTFSEALSDFFFHQKSWAIERKLSQLSLWDDISNQERNRRGSRTAGMKGAQRCKRGRRPPPLPPGPRPSPFPAWLLLLLNARETDSQQLRSGRGSRRGWSRLLPERRACPERNPGARQTPRKHLRVALAPVSCGHGRISRKTQAPGRGRGLGRGSQQLPFLKDVEVKFASRVLSTRSSRGFDHGDQSPWFSFPPPLVTIFTWHWKLYIMI